jgi:pilus assembly protein CpaC
MTTLSRLPGLCAIALVVTTSNPQAQAQAPQGAANPAPQRPLPAPEPSVDYPKIKITAGRSTVMSTDFDITRIAITNPAIADGVVVQPREILIDGKSAGTVSLIVWGAGGTRKQYDVVVETGVLVLEQQLKTLFPGEDIRVTVNEEALILSGAVSSNTIMLRAAEIAASSSGKLKVINMLQLPGGNESQQVMLQVRFAEVNRSALKELGINLVANRVDWAGRVTTGQYSAPTVNNDTTTFSDFLNIFFFSKREGIGGVLKALETKGYFQSLAEPNLIAYNGQEASFLAGGEFPVPFVSGAAGTVSVQFKEFGVRLNFKPTIAGDVIRLHVRPEVSSLDFNNGITITGFRIPALTTRRAETEVELRDGQTFAIAGLLNNTSQLTGQQIPWLSAIPIIGNLFKSKSDRAERTELMVLITPRLVRALDPDEVPPLPTTPRDFLPPPEREVPKGEKPAPPADAPPAQQVPLPPPPK